MNILDKLGKKVMLMDGAMGTMLQVKCLDIINGPELWNIENPNVVYNVHKEYIDAGAEIILTNTFGANSLKYGLDLSKYVEAGVSIAKKAAQDCKDKEVFVALDIGPLGKLLEPIGDVSFEQAYMAFKDTVIAGKNADIIVIETMTDLYEIKAALLAAKENSTLPVIVSFTLDSKGKLLTGADIETIVTLVEGLGADVIGMNCGFGPDSMTKWVEQLSKITKLPILVKPNAGLPVMINGKLRYDIEPDLFTKYMSEICKFGVAVVGGCCGTTPEYIKSLASLKGKSIKQREIPLVARVCSYGKSVAIGNKPIVIGERLNPTGKKVLKEAIINKDFNYMKQMALRQSEAGAHVLDVNMGLPEIDEVSMLKDVVKEIQKITDTPIQLDSSNINAIEEALRIYNGVPMINSVNGKKDIMNKIFPLAKKYGAIVVALTLDEKGIPETSEGRIKIAKKIISTAKKYGIPQERIIVDPLAMTISTGANNAKIALETIKYLKFECGINTILGVSNISFGLPNRTLINSRFFVQAMTVGLSAGIVDPNNVELMDSYYAYLALSGLDVKFEKYISKYSDSEDTNKAQNSMSVEYAICKGLNKKSQEETRKLLLTESAMDVINNHLIPALDEVGKLFETGRIFLPQLVASAESAQYAFAAVQKQLQSSGVVQEPKGTIIIATVEGDIHDIGKNIVRVVLENYGYTLIDLGKDVKKEKIVDCIIENKVKLVALSALMTTTVMNMEASIKLIHEKTDAKVMVGGAVLSEQYAKVIGADYYSKDAVGAARVAKEFFGK